MPETDHVRFFAKNVPKIVRLEIKIVTHRANTEVRGWLGQRTRFLRKGLRVKIANGGAKSLGCAAT